MASTPSNRAGSGYVNIGKYLGANKNSNVGNAVQGGIQSNLSNFRTGLTSAQDKFGKDVQSAALDTEANKNIQQEVLSRIGTLGKKEQVGGDTGIISDKDIGQYGTFRAGAYGGPQDLSEGAKFLNQSQNLQGIGQATKTESGRRGLLQNYAGGNQYTQGQQKLDSLLLGQQANKLGDINRSVQGLQGSTLNQLGQARDRANLQAANNQAFGQQAQNAVNTAQGLEYTNLDADVLAANTLRGTEQGNFLRGLETYNSALSPQLKDIGGQYSWGIDPNNSGFYNLGQEATKENVLTADREARLNALGRLSGSGVSNIPSMAKDPLDPTKNATFNSELYNNQVTARANEVNKGLEQQYAPDRQAIRDEYQPLIAVREQQRKFLDESQKELASLFTGGLNGTVSGNTLREQQLKYRIQALQNDIAERQLGINAVNQKSEDLERKIRQDRSVAQGPKIK